MVSETFPFIVSALRLSVQVAVVATFGVTIIGGAIAYCLTRYSFPGQTWLSAIVTLPLLMPPTVVGFYLLVLLGRQGILGKPLYDATGWTLVFTWQGAALAAGIVALPLMVKTTQAALQSVNSVYLEAASTLGQSEWQILWRVWLPLARKGIIAGILLSFTRALGEFGATLMIAGNIPGVTQTMPMAIYEAVQTGKNELAGILVAILSMISLTTLLITHSLEKQH